MAECVATPHSVVSRSIHPCVSAAHSRNLRNRPDGLAFNPLKCCRRNTGSLTAEISFRTQESLRCERRPGAPVRVSPTGNSSQEPIQLSAEAEEGYENVPAGEHSVSSIDFASSLVTAVGSDASSETELSGKKRRNRKGERKVYLMAAVASSVGFITLSAGAVYYRFYWQLQGSGEVPYSEMTGTFSLAIGAAVGMEYWARWAHKALWHDSLWNMHEVSA